MKIIAHSMKYMRLIVLFIFFSIIVSTGCILQDPTTNPSYSILPKIILDYDFDTHETKIWVRSALGDFKYDNITIRISYSDQKKIVMHNNTYGIYFTTTQNVFSLYTLVISEEKKFDYECNVDVDLTREDLIIITTFDEFTDEEIEEVVLENDLPYKKILNEIEENK